MSKSRNVGGAGLFRFVSFKSLAAVTRNCRGASSSDPSAGAAAAAAYLPLTTV